MQQIFYLVDKEYIYKIIALAMIYILFRNIPTRLITDLFYLLPVLVVVQIIYGYNHLTEPWQGLADVKGTFNNTGIFGGLVALGFVTGLNLILSTKPQKYYIDKILWGIILIPITIQLIYSQSRAAWLAAIAGTIILLFPKFRKLTKFNLVTLVTILLIIGILFSVKLYHFKKDSADGRLLIWTVSWNLIREKPLAGFGPNGFQKNYMLRQGDYLKEHPYSPWAILADDVQFPFNEFLKVAVKQGIIGLLLIAAFIFLIFKSCHGGIFSAILTALILFACFSYPLEFIEFQVLSVICLAGIACMQKPVAFFNKLKIKPIVRNSFVVLFIATGGFTVYSLYNCGLVSKYWNKKQDLEALQKMYPDMKNNASFMTAYAWELFLSERYEDSSDCFEKVIALKPSAHIYLRLGDAYKKTGRCDKALEAYQKAMYMVPSLFKPHYETAKILFEQQRYEEAQEKAKEIVNKKIKIDHPKIDRMKREMQAVLEYNKEINKLY